MAGQSLTQRQIRKYVMKEKFQKYAPRAGVVATSLFVTVAAHAGDYTQQLSAAGGEATANQTAVVGTVVGLAVVGFGVGMLLKWLNK
ncbi:hypothetical protein [uncultured Photobacterium sp.]|uniref:hypothetical protein n=1 Tax=uncultured Photobacterium sp. TaxID=173973 RepID=UPI00260FF332|nr:hypothetical protein [uncultured Photobacterium sp.]